MHAEPVLLVDHRQAEVAESQVGLQQRVGADGDVCTAAGETVAGGGPCTAALRAQDEVDLDAGGGAQRREVGEMLPRQDLGRRHQRRLCPGLDRGQHGEQRHHRLAAADVALQQPQHPRRRGHVVEDLADCLVLSDGELERQLLAQPIAQPAVADQRATAALAHVLAD